ncbi:MAG: hypothetical protein QM804_01125 [Propionicimonas sp.]
MTEYEIKVDPGYTARLNAGEARYAEALAKLDAAAAEATVAAARIREIEQAWEDGDGEVSASEYAVAQAEHLRLKALAKAAQENERQQNRERVSGDLDVAMAVAWAIQHPDLYPGGVVHVSDVEPTKPKIGEIYVVQSGSTRHLGAGWIAGSADVIVYGPTQLVASWRSSEIAKVLNDKIGFKKVTASDASVEQVRDKLWKSSATVTATGNGYAGFMWAPVPDVSAETSPIHTPSYGYGGLLNLLGDVVAKYTPHTLEQSFTLVHQITPMGAERQGDVITERYNLALAAAPRNPHLRSYEVAGPGTEHLLTAVRGGLLDLEGKLIPGLGTVHDVRTGGQIPGDWQHRYAGAVILTTKRKATEEDEDRFDTFPSSDPVDVDEIEDLDDDEIEPKDYDRTPDVDPSRKRAA